jgi:mono/diheme cytochrome c family protein
MALALVTGLLGACGPSDAPDPALAGTPSGASSAAPVDATPLTELELEQGVGPIRDLALEPLNQELADRGESAFTLKCSACHKLEARYVAPPLGDVLSRRRPEFVMNMILNADEMVQRHPDVGALLAEYFTPMPVQVTEESEARAILEYLRSAQIPSDQITR